MTPAEFQHTRENDRSAARDPALRSARATFFPVQTGILPVGWG